MCFRVFAVSMVAKFVSRVVVVLHLHSFCYLRRSAVVFVVAVHVAFVSSSWVVETMEVVVVVVVAHDGVGGAEQVRTNRQGW